MGDFDGIKIGVCDCYWTPAATTSVPNPGELFLGLTKGGVELTYTPEYHDLTVDQYGKTPVDSVLIGEAVLAKIPLAETDMAKLKLFAHTATWDNATKKLTFGRFPGFRLGDTGGKLRLHPIANGTSTLEDVTIYKAVNKSALQLNYKLEDETLYNCEFNGLVKRGNNNGSFLFEIGDSSTQLTVLLPDLSNLEALIKNIGGDFVVSPTVIPMIYGTADPAETPPHANTTSVALNCTYNTVLYDVTNKATYAPQISAINGNTLIDGSGNPTSALSALNGLITSKSTAVLTSYTAGGSAIVAGDIITTAISISWANRNHVITVRVTV
jgi:hypothetical protein